LLVRSTDAAAPCTRNRAALDEVTRSRPTTERTHHDWSLRYAAARRRVLAARIVAAWALPAHSARAP